MYIALCIFLNLTSVKYQGRNWGTDVPFGPFGPFSPLEHLGPLDPLGLLGLLGQLVLGIIVFFSSYFCRKNNEVLRNMYNDNLLAAGADEIEWADVTQGLLKLF